MRERVLVTGLGVVSPLGCLPEFWEGLRGGATGVAPIESFDPGPDPPRSWARARDFRPREHIGAALLRRMDHFSQMVVAACRMALADAALTLTPAEAEAAGLVVGTAFGNLSESEDFLRGLFAKGPARANPLTFPNLVLNAPTGYAAMELGLRGPNLTVCEGEASGEAALALAYDTIVSGQADVLLAGGGDEIAPVLFQVYKDFGVLSPLGNGAGRRRKKDPASREWSSPFDRRRNGFVMGEGTAVLVLERSDRAHARGAPIYGELAGYATEAVAASPHDWPRRGAAAASETARQLAALDCRADAIDLVVSCANSTAALDAFEAARLATLLGEGASRTLVTSVKGAIGEFGGAGALGAAAALLALRHGDVPRLGTLADADPGCALHLAAPGAAPPAGGVRTALVSATPRGGACLTLCFREAHS